MVASFVNPTPPNQLPRFLLDMLAAVPRAKEGVHNWLYRVARQLHAHRTREEIVALLAAAVAGCGRAVPVSEVAAAVDSAKNCAWQPTGRNGSVPAAPGRTWPAVDHEQRAAIIRDGGGLADLWETSPARIESNAPHSEEIIDALFPGNPLLCCGKSSSVFDTKPRATWRGELSALQLLVPSPMLTVEGVTKDGRPSRHTLSNTGPRRFLVVEFDSGTADEHAAILLHLASRAPMVCAVHSGNKSLHGWFYCASEPEEDLRRFMESAVSLGADRATWTRSQFVRMPDGTRDTGKRQTVYFFNPRPIQLYESTC